MNVTTRFVAGCLTTALLSIVPTAGAVQDAAPAPAPADPAYTALRAPTLGTAVAAVSDLTVKRDAGTFTFKRGELYFTAPVEGRVTGAVFVGDGEFTLTPPTENEKQALAIYAKSPTLVEPFSEAVLRFSDKTFDEIKAKATMSESGPQASRAADVYRDHVNFAVKELHWNFPLRTLVDIRSQEEKGFFYAFVKGKNFGKLAYFMDPTGAPIVDPEQIALFSFGTTDGGIWTAFPMSGGRQEDAKTYDISQHDLSVTIKGTQLIATDTVTLKTLYDGVRVLPFDLYPTLRVSKVTDASGATLSFVQQPKDEDAQFAVLLPAAPSPNTDVTLTIEYAGDEALRDSGGGNFILLPRDSWYPNNGSSAFGDRARFRTRFIYPSNVMLVGTGALAEPETKEGNLTVAKWTSGDTELAVSGFNYGKFKKKEVADQDTGLTIEFFANTQLPNELRDLQREIDEIERAGGKTMTTLGAMNTTRMADAALADAQNATRLYSAYFGKLPYSRIAMSQQPAAGFGQAWPTLIYMPYTAYLDTTIRTQLMGVRGGTDTFWKYVGPHEVAHQWWGHLVGWKSYRDQWMSEGFAEFSSSIYVQQIYGIQKFVELWEDHRKAIVEPKPATENKAPYTIGPVTQGLRLSGSKTGNAYRFLVYPKGAYILHMLRMMMYDFGKTRDEKFIAMMKDFIQTHYNQDVSTEDFKRAVDKHVTPGMNLMGNGKLDWFFDEWVYGTEVPSYRLEYSLRDEGGKTILTAKATQSGVSEKFRMLVPLYLDFGKGWVRLGQLTMNGNTTFPFEVPLPQRPKAVQLNALNDVLFVKNETVGK
jgi:hypothetical protein